MTTNDVNKILSWLSKQRENNVVSNTFKCDLQAKILAFFLVITTTTDELLYNTIAYNSNTTPTEIANL